jgi:hypothetical protein
LRVFSITKGFRFVGRGFTKVNTKVKEVNERLDELAQEVENEKAKDKGNAIAKQKMQCAELQSSKIEFVASFKFPHQERCKIHLVLLWMNGELPSEDVRHINRDKSDNRFSNLKEVTRSESQATRKLGCRNTSGCTGVIWDKKANKWLTYIWMNGKRKKLGLFIRC